MSEFEIDLNFSWKRSYVPIIEITLLDLNTLISIWKRSISWIKYFTLDNSYVQLWNFSFNWAMRFNSEEKSAIFFFYTNTEKPSIAIYVTILSFDWRTDCPVNIHNITVIWLSLNFLTFQYQSMQTLSEALTMELIFLPQLINERLFFTIKCKFWQSKLIWTNHMNDVFEMWILNYFFLKTITLVILVNSRDDIKSSM